MTNMGRLGAQQPKWAFAIFCYAILRTQADKQMAVSLIAEPLLSHCRKCVHVHMCACNVHANKKMRAIGLGGFALHAYTYTHTYTFTRM